MIDWDLRHLVELMVTHGMAPLCENSQNLSRIGWLPFQRSYDIPGKLSPLAFALVMNRPRTGDGINWFLVFVYSSPQQGDLRLSGPPSGQGAGGGAQTRDRRVPADLRADSLATVPPTPL
ncbi:hypothetical protein PoB_001170300 [Plakobranchus ocellatus]|uniref:Uncharacterized protein n=1 Tax=Plakobranchus ocellatus TaxID=259542 RepID=A0AAV3YS56_9GAST|nr:hypothetical protein PoB_001170300 [Plakobranchus ocellatus]